MKTTKEAYIGIDASLTGTGVVVLDNRGRLFDHYTLTTKPKDGGLETRLEEIYDHIAWLVAQGPRMVALEGFAFGSKTAASTMGAVGGVVRLALAKAEVNFVVVPPTTLKKFVTGKGTGPKDQMAVHASRKWNVMMNDNNQWDAYGLARLAHTYFHSDRAAGSGKLADRSTSILEALSLPKYQTDSLKAVEPCYRLL